jgi:methionyl-tRNA synthetase
VSWDSFERRYNADLANDFGNLLNRTVTMAGRYLPGEWPRARPGGPLAALWPEVSADYGRAFESLLLHEALAALWRFVGDANRFVDAEQPWVLAKAARSGDTAAAERLAGALGDLLEACRLITFAAAPFLPASAPRAAAQLGVAYDYAADGNGGPPLDQLLHWGAGPTDGQLGTAAPLFPRLEVVEPA